MTQAQRGHMAMLTFSALVAGSFSLGAQIANEIEPAALNAVRFAIATVLIGLLVWRMGGLTRAAAQAPWRYVMLGALMAVYFVLMFEGLKTARPVSAAAVFTLTPVISGFVGWILLRQVATPRMALALAIGCAGALWVIFRADLRAMMSFDIGRGEMIYFWGCIAHAIYTPMIRKLNRGEPAMVFTFGMLVAATILLLLVAWSDLRAMDWKALRPFAWWTILYLAVFSTGTSFVLTQYAALRLPAAKVMAYTYLTPSWVLLWELAQGRGAPPLLVLGGVVLTIVALILLLKDEEPVQVRAQQSPE
ncbi:DMT family transporter [Ruegeria sp. 2205SS24-7]|uniref:DMT family transporter n=1 Tax=Ruegeria discodermiae TaxID=3064389 RepID=UPI0027427333|nr:DMT family transporter [Ruegeria sp. 2205SS24-7]MDP5218194.1 DMT family transporter [Ruegeria sp. 2205SS24-7]